MSKVDFHKVRIVGLAPHYKLLMQELHRKGILEVIDRPDFASESPLKPEEHFEVFALERLDFAIRFLTPYQGKTSVLNSILTGGKIVMTEDEAKQHVKNFSPQSEEVVKQAEEIEEQLVRLKNEQQKIASREGVLKPFAALDMPVSGLLRSEQTRSWVGSLPTRLLKNLTKELAQLSNLVDVHILHHDKTKSTMRVSAYWDLEEEVQLLLQQAGFEDIDFGQEATEYADMTVREVLKAMHARSKDIAREQKELEKQARTLAKHLRDLCILYDYNAWRKTKNELQRKMYRSANVFAFEAWVPEPAYDSLAQWIWDIFVGEVSIETAEIAEEDKAPSYVENNKAFVAPFELVTAMYGLPGKNDIDPTPFLAPFFFIFFGLCLSDVGYGALLTIFMGAALLFVKLDPAARSALRAMLYCGISTIIGGVLLGGYFGMSTDQAPAFMVNPETGMFYGQLLNPMSGSGPLTFLTIALGIGIVQLLFGIVLDGIRRLKNGDTVGAIADSGAWFFFLVMLVGFAVADYISLPKDLMGRLALAGAAILVLTQGRSQKNWFLKPIFGILGLYNITGYMSDLLSYSRIMALGLSTGVIGMAMNLTAGVLGGLMPHPAIGIPVAILILLAGHGLNFALSLLSAFVHSGRLQFIEFFGKFYEGDGRAFEPFVRHKKYLFFRN